ETAFHELVTACAGRTDVPQLQFGQEILVPDPGTAEAAFAAATLGIGGTRYALIEFGFDLGDDAPGVVRAARAAGRQPIVAHPERYRRNGAPTTVDEIRAWKDAGALLQLNGGSVLGGYGEAIEELAWRLLREGLIDLISTDHHADARPVSPAHVGRRPAPSSPSTRSPSYPAGTRCPSRAGPCPPRRDGPSRRRHPRPTAAPRGAPPRARGSSAARASLPDCPLQATHIRFRKGARCSV